MYCLSQMSLAEERHLPSWSQEQSPVVNMKQSPELKPSPTLGVKTKGKMSHGQSSNLDLEDHFPHDVSLMAGKSNSNNHSSHPSTFSLVHNTLPDSVLHVPTRERGNSAVCDVNLPSSHSSFKLTNSDLSDHTNETYPSSIDEHDSEQGTAHIFQQLQGDELLRTSLTLAGGQRDSLHTITVSIPYKSKSNSNVNSNTNLNLGVSTINSGMDCQGSTSTDYNLEDSKASCVATAICDDSTKLTVHEHDSVCLMHELNHESGENHLTDTASFNIQSSFADGFKPGSADTFHSSSIKKFSPEPILFWLTNKNNILSIDSLEPGSNQINNRSLNEPSGKFDIGARSARPPGTGLAAVTRSAPDVLLESQRQKFTQNPPRLGTSFSIVRSSTSRRRVRDLHADDYQVLVGNRISEGHENYILAYNMLTGIRVAVSRNSGVMARLKPYDFSATKKLTFNTDGSEITPSSRYDFKFKDYAPRVFRDLRSLFGLDPADYLVSITGKYILSELGSPGKSGSFFYYSRDFRFIIKTIHHSEHRQLLHILKKYHAHIKANPNTLILQFYGLHRVKMHLKYGGLCKVHFVVMNNLFAPHRDIHVKYDLKGSTWGRSTFIPPVGPNGSLDLLKMTLKDLNWLDRQDYIQFGPNKRRVFFDQLTRDVALLKDVNVMDYSLLLGIHDTRRGNDNDMCQKLSVFDPKSADKIDVFNTEPRDIDREHELPHNVYPGRSTYIFYGHDGGIRATDGDNMPLPEIYYLGIIDCLTNYSFRKRLETIWRSLLHPRATISAVPANEYGDRFLNFIKSGTRTTKGKLA